MHVYEGEPTRKEGEPSLVFRGRLMYWHHNPDAPPYDTLDVDARSMWTQLASAMDDIMLKAPRDSDDTEVSGGFSRHAGGPGLVAPAAFSNATK